MVLLHALLILAVGYSPALAAEADTEVEDCLVCHGDAELEAEDADGEPRSLFVDPGVYAGSVHGDHRCSDCHAGFEDWPHPADQLVASREMCRRCHFENYALTLDSAHEPLVARGDAHAPTCTSCHGAHDVAPPGEPRSRISRTCAHCHAGVSRVYERSVHGHALVADGNPDVPVCTDCHRSHDVRDPGDQHSTIHELCAECHTNEALMARYGLSTYVVQSYLADFHGVTARFGGGAGGERLEPVTAQCVDCHGVHDISVADSANSPVLRQNLAETCRRCHPGASDSFPSAWLSHYEPSWERAPLVHAVNVFYSIFIPFVIGGLALQILMHLWRVVANR